METMWCWLQAKSFTCSMYLQLCIQVHYEYTASPYSEARSLVCGQLCYFFLLLFQHLTSSFYDHLWTPQSYDLHVFTTFVSHEVCLLMKTLSQHLPSARLWLNCACPGNPNMVRQLGPCGNVEMWDNQIVIPSIHAITPRADTEV